MICKTKGAAATLDLFSCGQTSEEAADPLLHLDPASRRAHWSVPGTPRWWLSRPTPDCLIGIEVRTVARQVDQPQVQTRRPQVLPHRLAPVGRRESQITFCEPTVMPLPQLSQEGCLRRRCQLLFPSSSTKHSDLPALQTHRRIVAGRVLAVPPRLLERCTRAGHSPFRTHLPRNSASR